MTEHHLATEPTASWPWKKIISHCSMAIEHPPFQGRWMTWGDGNPATDWAYAAERAGEVALNHPF